MIIVRTPLRIPIAGGGTDLPAWYSQHGSMFISASINKYIYTTLHYSGFNPNIRLRYSKMEEVSNLDDLQNEIARETLRICNVRSNVEITSHAEIPSGTGLGSSGSFGVGVLHALRPSASQQYLAEEATHIQIDTLGYPIGKQDQYAAAYGGFNCYEISKEGFVDVVPLVFRNNFIYPLQERLVLMYTGIKRDTNEVLKKSTTDGLRFIQGLAQKTFDLFAAGDIDGYGHLLNEHWEYKKQRGGMTNPQIDRWYESGLQAGAIGGKLIGAGGGGFLMFYTKNKSEFIDRMADTGLLHVPFGFEFDGSRILLNQ